MARRKRYKHKFPMVKFRKKDGTSFWKTYHSREAAAKSVRAWRARGGVVLRTKAESFY